MKIIVGLGNPGEKYINTRHNAGYILIDSLASEQGLEWETNKKLDSLVIKNNDVLYIKPKSFMNDSGITVQKVLSYYKLLPKKMAFFNKKNSDLSEVLTIIHDDLDIDLGKYKVSTDSRAAGHNGVQSIINHIKTKNFTRIRLGINTDKKKLIPGKNFVLGRFSQEEKERLEEIFPDITKNYLYN